MSEGSFFVGCIIVDDEELARKLLTDYIEKVAHLELKGSFSNPVDAMDFLRIEQVDLLFLDIQMPDLTGVELLKTLSRRPQVIFTTAYSEHAVEGFELDAIDYLLKPIPFERFLKSANKAMDHIALLNKHIQPDPSQEKESKGNYLMVKTGRKFVRLKIEELLFVKGEREYVSYHTHDKKYLALASLKDIEQELPEGDFVRIHKSYIVALNRIESVEGNQLQVKSHQLPIGSSFKEELLRALNL